MSEYADKHSKPDRKARVEHIIGVDPKAKIDASGYTPSGSLDAEAKTGLSKPKPRAYAKGGKVEGHKAHHHAGRKSRDAGGPTAVQQLRPNVPTGGLYGSGFAPTHAGLMSSAAGLKKGGEAKKRAHGGKAASDIDGTRPTGGRHAKAKGGEASFHATRPGDPTRRFSTYDEAHRFAMREGDRNRLWQIHPRPAPAPNANLTNGDRKPRADGGRAKGKTNINIIIGSPKDQDQPPVPPPPSAMPPAPPQPRPGLPPAAMGAMAGPGAMGAPAGAAGPGMPPQMPPRG